MLTAQISTKLKKYTATISILLFLSLSFNAYIAPVYSQEEESTDKLEELLLLQIPNETDNPNFTITFTDPSEDEEGISIKVDGKESKNIKSPYTLPSLAVGKHTLTFIFTDENGTEQVVEKSISIVPRPPILNPPENMDNNQLSLSGTALASSRVYVFLSSEDKNYKAETDVSEVGEWEYVQEGELEPGVYTLVAFVKKDGFGSSFSEPLIFSVSQEGAAEEENEPVEEEMPFTFSIDSFTSGNVIQNISRNPDFIALIVGLLAGGFILGMIINKLANFHHNRASENMFKSLLGRDGSKEEEKTEPSTKSSKKEEKSAKKDKREDKDEDEDEETAYKSEEEKRKRKRRSLREKFEGAGFKVDNIVEDGATTDEEADDVTDDVKEPRKSHKTEKSLSKEEFLKKFKDHDPDNQKQSATKKGKKTNSTKVEKDKNRNIKITLTSGSVE